MKIRKTFVGNLPDNKIVNSNSTSETDTYSCKYLNERNVIVSSEEPTTGEEVWLEKGKNLIDENLLIFGMELDGKGGTIARSNYYITPFIEIESNTTYTFKGAKSLKGTDNYYTDYYDKDYNFISSNEFSTFTTPSNAKYVRFNGCSDFSIDLQLEKGEKIAPKKIHTKTDNGYEEFYNEEDTKNTTIFNGVLTVGSSVTLKDTKRFLDVYYSIYPNSSGCLTGKYTIYTNKAGVTYGSTVALAHDSTNGLEYYVDESSFDLNTKILTHTRSGYFNVSSGTYAGRDTSSYTVYRIETYD